MDESQLPHWPNANAGPIQELPNEILARIFTLGTRAWQDREPRTLPFPILISSICSHWRQLAHITPNLWAYILVPLHKRSEEDCLTWISEWRERSGALPISVILDDTLGYPDKLPDLIKDLLDIITQQPHCLGRLVIRLSATGLDLRTNDMNRMALASSLREVSLYLSEHPFLVAFASFRQAFQWLQSLPNLTRLSLGGIWLAPIVPNLTSLTLKGLHATQDHARAIFAASPNLTHLVLAELCPLQPRSLSPERIEALSLQSLAVSLTHVHGMRDNRSVYLPSVLNTPNLSYLEIDGEVSIYLVFGPTISLPKIDTLRISNCPQYFFSNPDGQRDINLFHSLTSLRHLQVIRAPMDGLLTRQNPNRRGLVRRRSINTQKPVWVEETSGSAQVGEGPPTEGLPWPELRSITLDTLLSSDVLCLCQYVSAHGRIRRIQLSKSAMRHLTGSMRREGDRIFQHATFADRLTKAPGSSALLSPLKVPHHDVKGTKDVREWLSKSVEIRDMESPFYGMLDAERIP
ncbi:unnamed protein product [Cyclocybe aegerita]|uniref:F-box domain-containing protein n=1 Tax=Cyclocybe aegerita TaxID=1973307 RepID=A0A8S0VVP5_CYCAE|nr:unnamed protein product [Cyclocybe aegerita]